MVKVKTYRTWHCPVIICDVCGEQIKHEGNAEWREGDDNIYHTHKGQCSAELRRGKPGVWFWQPLDAFLWYLVHNTKIDLRSAKETADLLSEL